MLQSFLKCLVKSVSQKYLSKYLPRLSFQSISSMSYSILLSYMYHVILKFLQATSGNHNKKLNHVNHIFFLIAALNFSRLFYFWEW